MPFLFFFNDTATTEIYTLSLHDALPISGERSEQLVRPLHAGDQDPGFERDVAEQQVQELGQVAAHGAGIERDHGAGATAADRDRKSTRLNSSHGYISYAVFCLKKKNKST